MKIPNINLDKEGTVTNMKEIGLWAQENNIIFRSSLERAIEHNMPVLSYMELQIATLLHCNEVLLDTMHFQMTGTPRTDHNRETSMKNYIKEKAAKEASKPLILSSFLQQG